MKAQLRQDTTVRTIYVDITDGPVLDATRPWHKSPRKFRAEFLHIEVQDGRMAVIQVRGGQILKSGEVSENTSQDLVWHANYLSRSFDTEHVPDWIMTLASEATQGVTSWTLPEGA